MQYHLAIDIGASSGRHIVGWTENGEIKTKEVYRFPNRVTELDGHLVWDVDALLHHVKTGIAEAKKLRGKIPASFDYDIYPVSAEDGFGKDALLSGIAEFIAFSEDK